MADQAGGLKFVDFHNIAGYLLDPPPLHKEFQSMIVGLNSCRISHALRATPVIHKDLINAFWSSAFLNRQGANGLGTIESIVKGEQVIISEQIIREVLLFGDKPEFPTEFAADKITGVLEQMCYEGSFPPTIKKLLPPYWRFLVHTFVSCVSGRKGGSDEISHTATSAIVALVMDWDYNFSRYVFEEMTSKLSGKKKDLFLMYPRFLQMIFDDKYPGIERTADKLDLKALGPNTFGLMKQARKATKVAFKGLKELVKFGKFAETENVPQVRVIYAEVAEKHVAPPTKFSFSFEDVSDDEEDIPPYQPMEESVRETVVQPVVPTPEQIKPVKDLLQSTALKPPQSVVAAFDQSASDQERSDPDLVPRKRKRRDPRPEVLMITDPIQKSTPDESVPMTQDVQSPVIEEEEEENVFVEETNVAGSSSPSSAEESLSASEKRRVFELEQGLVEKDLMIGKLDVRVSGLEKDNSEKDKKISELQANLGGLTALFFDLKQRLIQKFGDEFKSSHDDSGSAPGGSENAPGSVPSSGVSGCESSRPAPNENIDQYMSTGLITAEERRAKQREIDQREAKRAKRMLIMKNFDQNVVSSDRLEIFITDVGKKFSDKYEDRSGIRMWGYEADKAMWIVKRKSGNIEYYDKKTDFMSWTKVDLSELIQAPFHNPTNEPMAWAFKTFLEDQAKKNFEEMKTASSFTKKAKGVIDPTPTKLW